ncbi:hypothetical protein WMY93_000120 [Mugilogobius chulae]|uniref:Uncharacterized protein n=1 Tax=Mugilogobius chulae TaxID=88201 RepID=A0AAW0Q184_9GOBI
MSLQSSDQSRVCVCSELEEFVADLQRSVRSGPGSVSLRDVELAAVNLRKVGQAMALLKGEFPQLQSRMCSVLRLEVEVMRFLKEEPLKMDSMLSRIRSLTEDLSTLHRSVSESFVQSRDSEQTQGSPKPLPRSSFKTPHNGSDSGTLESGPASPNVARRSTASTASTERNEPPQNTEESTRLAPDGRVSPDANQTKPDQTRTESDQPDSSQSQSDRPLQDLPQDLPRDQLRSRESPVPNPALVQTSPAASGAEREKSKHVEEEKTKPKDEAESRVFKRPQRPSTDNKSIKVNASPPQGSSVSSSVTNVKSVDGKQAAGPQVEREKVQVTKPPRQPPEVKPKPQKSAALKGNSSSNHCPATTTAEKKEPEDTTEVTVERTCSTCANHNQTKETSAFSVLPSSLQTHTDHFSTDRTPENHPNSSNSYQTNQKTITWKLQTSS